MYSAKNQLKFTYQIISDKEFNISKLKEKFPILTKKESIKALKAYLTINKIDNKFIVCIQKLYVCVGIIDTKILINEIENIKNSLPDKIENILQQLTITIFPQTDQFGFDIPVEILQYLSKNDIQLSLSGIFLCS